MNKEEESKKITLPYRLVYLTNLAISEPVSPTEQTRKLYDDPTDLDDDPLATLGLVSDIGASSF